MTLTIGLEVEVLKLGVPVVFGGDPDPGVGCRSAAELARGVDLPFEGVGVDGEPVDISEGDPGIGEDAVEFDDPPHEVGGRLLPEGLLASSEELVQQRGEGVGEAVAVHVGVEGVPLPASAQGDLDVVVLAAVVGEELPDVVAEVALDLEDESRGSLSRVVRLPGEELLCEGAHASAGLSGADGSEDGDAGVEAALGYGEPPRPAGLRGLDGMMEFAQDEGRRLVLGGGRPVGEDAASSARRLLSRAEPDPDRAGEQEDSSEGDDAGRSQVPGPEEGVDGRVVVLDEVEQGVLADGGEGPDLAGPSERSEAGREGDQEADGDGAPERPEEPAQASEERGSECDRAAVDESADGVEDQVGGGDEQGSKDGPRGRPHDGEVGRRVAGDEVEPGDAAGGRPGGEVKRPEEDAEAGESGCDSDDGKSASAGEEAAQERRPRRRCRSGRRGHRSAPSLPAGINSGRERPSRGCHIGRHKGDPFVPLQAAERGGRSRPNPVAWCGRVAAPEGRFCRNGARETRCVRRTIRRVASMEDDATFGGSKMPQRGC